MRQKSKRLIKPLSDQSAPTERHLIAFSLHFSYDSDKIKICLFLKFYALSDEIVYFFEIRFLRRRWLVCARTQRETVEWLAQICSSRTSKARNQQKFNQNCFYKRFSDISDQKRCKNLVKRWSQSSFVNKLRIKGGAAQELFGASKLQINGSCSRV